MANSLAMVISDGNETVSFTELDVRMIRVKSDRNYIIQVRESGERFIYFQTIKGSAKLTPIFNRERYECLEKMQWLHTRTTGLAVWYRGNTTKCFVGRLEDRTAWQAYFNQAGDYAGLEESESTLIGRITAQECPESWDDPGELAGEGDHSDIGTDYMTPTLRFTNNLTSDVINFNCLERGLITWKPFEQSKATEDQLRTEQAVYVRTYTFPDCTIPIICESFATSGKLEELEDAECIWAIETIIDGTPIYAVCLPEVIRYYAKGLRVNLEEPVSLQFLGVVPVGADISDLEHVWTVDTENDWIAADEYQTVQIDVMPDDGGTGDPDHVDGQLLVGTIVGDTPSAQFVRPYDGVGRIVMLGIASFDDEVWAFMSDRDVGGYQSGIRAYKWNPDAGDYYTLAESGNFQLDWTNFTTIFYGRAFVSCGEGIWVVGETTHPNIALRCRFYDGGWHNYDFATSATRPPQLGGIAWSEKTGKLYISWTKRDGTNGWDRTSYLSSVETDGTVTDLWSYAHGAVSSNNAESGACEYFPATEKIYFGMRKHGGTGELYVCNALDAVSLAFAFSTVPYTAHKSSNNDGSTMIFHGPSGLVHTTDGSAWTEESGWGPLYGQITLQARDSTSRPWYAVLDSGLGTDSTIWEILDDWSNIDTGAQLLQAPYDGLWDTQPKPLTTLHIKDVGDVLHCGYEETTPPVDAAAAAWVYLELSNGNGLWDTIHDVGNWCEWSTIWFDWDLDGGTCTIYVKAADEISVLNSLPYNIVIINAIRMTGSLAGFLGRYIDVKLDPEGCGDYGAVKKMVVTGRIRIGWEG